MHLRKLIPSVLCAAVWSASLQAAPVPRKSPEFAINTMDQKQILLSQHRGKVVALLFILTGCPHCQATTGVLTKLQKEYGARGLQVLSAAIEDTAARDVPRFIQQFQPAYPVGFANRLSVGQYLQSPPGGRMMMPQLVIIDRSGMIREQHTGDEPYFQEGVQEKNLRASIEALLGPETKSVPKAAPKAATRGKR
jgi:thiol-disulfide isomerase/thioredoxin